MMHDALMQCVGLRELDRSQIPLFLVFFSFKLQYNSPVPKCAASTTYFEF